MQIRHLKIKDRMTVLELIQEMGKSGVLGAGRLARATQLLADSIENEETAIFLSVAGPIVPGGLRQVIVDLINDGFIDVVVTSGANITHDLVESMGGSHYRGMQGDDEELQKQGMGRMGDIYTRSQDFETFETRISDILTQISKDNKIISIREFLTLLGEMIDDDNSILKTAARKGVPIYAPGLIDSMLGLQLWMFTQDNEFYLDAVGDMHELSDKVFGFKKVTAVMLGGGLPKHYTLASNLLTGGIDAGIQVTMDRSEGGSLSGAPLEEAKSWAKARAGSSLVTVIGDVTIIFPLMVAAARELINKDR